MPELRAATHGSREISTQGDRAPHRRQRRPPEQMEHPKLGFHIPRRTLKSTLRLENQ